MFADVDHAGSPAELVETAEVVEGVAALPTERLEAEIRQMAAHLAAAMCRWLLLVAEYDRRRAWESWECLSCAHWVSWICGISMSTAHEHVRVARAIETLPLVREGFASGERRLSWEWNDDGSVTGRFHLGADEGHVLIAAVQRQVEAERLAQQEEAKARGLPPGDDRSLPEARADGLLAIARMALAAEANTSDVIVLPELLVHIEADADGTVAAQIDDGPNLHPAAAARLGCDASIQAMIEHDGDPLHVGRRTRKINRRLRRAVLHTTGGLCAFPGCSTRARHIHHLIHWLHDGPTDVENLAPLCWRHHHAVHEGGWTLRRTVTGYAADKPRLSADAGTDLRTLTAIPDPLTGQPKLHLLPDQPTSITPDTPTLSWAGEPFDLHWIVGVLCDRQHVRTQLAATGTMADAHPSAGATPRVVEMPSMAVRSPDAGEVVAGDEPVAPGPDKGGCTATGRWGRGSACSPAPARPCSPPTRR